MNDRKEQNDRLGITVVARPHCHAIESWSSASTGIYSTHRIHPSIDSELIKTLADSHNQLQITERREPNLYTLSKHINRLQRTGCLKQSIQEPLSLPYLLLVTASVIIHHHTQHINHGHHPRPVFLAPLLPRRPPYGAKASISYSTSITRAATPSIGPTSSVWFLFSAGGKPSSTIYGTNWRGARRLGKRTNLQQPVCPAFVHEFDQSCQ
jgi:hypothetical protein